MSSRSVSDSRSLFFHGAYPGGIHACVRANWEQMATLRLLAAGRGFSNAHYAIQYHLTYPILWLGALIVADACPRLERHLALCYRAGRLVVTQNCFANGTRTRQVTSPAPSLFSSKRES